MLRSLLLETAALQTVLEPDPRKGKDIFSILPFLEEHPQDIRVHTTPLIKRQSRRSHCSALMAVRALGMGRLYALPQSPQPHMCRCPSAQAQSSAAGIHHHTAPRGAKLSCSNAELDDVATFTTQIALEMLLLHSLAVQHRLHLSACSVV